MIKKIDSDLCCVNNSCKKIGLRLESFLDVNDECIEGFLSCKVCNSKYPIIQGVPILLENFHEYSRKRIMTLGKWIKNSKSTKLKSFIKSECTKIHSPTDTDPYEENNLWNKFFLN